MKEKLAWLGGIIDGEGSISIDKKYNRPNRLEIGNTNQLLINKICSILSELEIPFRCYRRDRPNSTKPFITVDITGVRRIKEICRLTLPYLTAKRDKAKYVLNFIPKIIFQKWGRPLSPSKHLRKTLEDSYKRIE